MTKYQRDPATGALLSTDTEAKRAYINQRNRASKLDGDINTLNDRVTKLEALVQQLLRGQQHDNGS